MKVFNFIYPFLISCVISSSHSSSDSSGGGSSVLGNAICDTDYKMKTECGVEDIPVESLPKECTAFSYWGVELSSGIVDDPIEKIRPKGNLDSIGALGKPLIVVHARMCMWEFVRSIKTDQAKLDTEIASWKEYFEKHKAITGLALYRTELNVTDPEDPEYTQNLIDWIAIMKCHFPKLIIGLYINIGTMENTNKELKSIDLMKLDSSLDFYRMLSTTASHVLSCNSAKGKYGDILMNGCNQNAQDYLNAMKIPKEKIIWDIWGTPSNENLDSCTLTYPNMCLKPNENVYCANTLPGYYEMGKYLKENAGGFALNFIDLDDANGVCNCGKFPIFYALWNGITGGSPPEECCLIDRPVQ